MPSNHHMWTNDAQAGALYGTKTMDTPEADAIDSVNRESDRTIVTPAYTASALWQMGWERSKGMNRAYRLAFADAFATRWSDRYYELTGKHA